MIKSLVTFQFAIMTYGETARVVKTFEDMTDLETKINNISRTGKFTYTGSALQTARDLFNEAREDVPWSVLLVTDGRSKVSEIMIVITDFLLWYFRMAL